MGGFIGDGGVSKGLSSVLQFLPSFNSSWLGSILERCGFTVHAVVQGGRDICRSFSPGCTRALCHSAASSLVHLCSPSADHECVLLGRSESPQSLCCPLREEKLRGFALVKDLRMGKGRGSMLCLNSGSWLVSQAPQRSGRIFVSSHIARAWPHSATATPDCLPLLSCLGFHLWTGAVIEIRKKSSGNHLSCSECRST